MKVLSVVFKDLKLFAFSIKENITLKEDEEVLKILEKLGFLENMKKFDKGVHTAVYKEFDDDVIELSGGESQKLSIACSLYKNGGVVVLYELTAALDQRFECGIYMRFNDLI